MESLQKFGEHMSTHTKAVRKFLATLGKAYRTSMGNVGKNVYIKLVCVILIGKKEGSIKLCLIKRNRPVKESVDIMFIIVQIHNGAKPSCLENLHPLPNAYGNAVETFKTKEEAHKLLELLWDIDVEEQQKNNIHVWRMH